MAPLFYWKLEPALWDGLNREIRRLRQDSAYFENDKAVDKFMPYR